MPSRTGRPNFSSESAEGWRLVDQTTTRWLVETDWWREPVRRDDRRCLPRSGDCVELYRDVTTGTWYLAQRYD